MRTIQWILHGVACILLVVTIQGSSASSQAVTSTEQISLPDPGIKGNVSVEQALQDRRSVREYRDEPLSLKEVSQLLWSAQGLTGGHLRTAPSAGALYPLEVYVVVGNVKGLSPGVYKYAPADHILARVSGGDRRLELFDAAASQPPLKNAPVDIVISGVYERTTGKYDTSELDRLTGASYPRGVRYVHMEAGHAAQNVCLQAESLGLGTVPIGAFSDDEVRRILSMPEDERPLYVMPVGKRV